MANTSAAAMSEILGIPSTSSPATPASESPAPTKLTAYGDDDEIVKTSTTSVNDYFKNLMKARAAGGSTTSAPLPTPKEEEDDRVEIRAGLGSGSRQAVSAPPLTSPHVSTPIPIKIEEDIGLTTKSKKAKGKRRRDDDIEPDTADTTAAPPKKEKKKKAKKERVEEVEFEGTVTLETALAGVEADKPTEEKQKKKRRKKEQDSL